MPYAMKRKIEAEQLRDYRKKEQLNLFSFRFECVVITRVQSIEFPSSIIILYIKWRICWQPTEVKRNLRNWI